MAPDLLDRIILGPSNFYPWDFLTVRSNVQISGKSNPSINSIPYKYTLGPTITASLGYEITVQARGSSLQLFQESLSQEVNRQQVLYMIILDPRLQICVLSMSRQGDPTARCLTTERTIRMSAHDEKENQIRGLSIVP